MAKARRSSRRVLGAFPWLRHSSWRQEHISGPTLKQDNDVEPESTLNAGMDKANLDSWDDSGTFRLNVSLAAMEAQVNRAVRAMAERNLVEIEPTDFEQRCSQRISRPTSSSSVRVSRPASSSSVRVSRPASSSSVRKSRPTSSSSVTRGCGFEVRENRRGADAVDRDEVSRIATDRRSTTPPRLRPDVAASIDESLFGSHSTTLPTLMSLPTLQQTELTAGARRGQHRSASALVESRPPKPPVEPPPSSNCSPFPSKYHALPTASLKVSRAASFGALDQKIASLPGATSLLLGKSSSAAYGLSGSLSSQKAYAPSFAQLAAWPGPSCRKFYEEPPPPPPPRLAQPGLIGARTVSPRPPKTPKARSEESNPEMEVDFVATEFRQMRLRYRGAAAAS